MRSFTLAAVLFSLLIAEESQAQITVPRILSTQPDRLANLKEQLTNRLRATRNDQKAFINHAVELVRQGRLNRSLVVALERYSLRRNSSYPFPFFERALRYESAKRGVAVPMVKQFATTRSRPRG